MKEVPRIRQFLQSSVYTKKRKRKEKKNQHIALMHPLISILWPDLPSLSSFYPHHHTSYLFCGKKSLCSSLDYISTHSDMFSYRGRIIVCFYLLLVSMYACKKRQKPTCFYYHSILCCSSCSFPSYIIMGREKV